MDVLDLFLKKYSYKFPKGYPDMNNEQDILLMEGILSELGINEEDKQKEEKSDYDGEILNLLTTLSDDEAKKKVISYLNKINKKEDKDDDKLEAELEKQLKSKNINEEITEYITLLASKYNIIQPLKDYLESNKLLSLNDLGKDGNLYNIIKSNTDFPEAFIKKIINYTPSEGNKALGIGEIALVLFTNGEKQVVGDIGFGNITVELKGSGARFPGNGRGRSGDISSIYQDFAKKYPNIELKTKESSLSVYISKILNQDPNSLDFINKELNNLYPNSENIKIESGDDIGIIKNIIYKKYISSYVNSHKNNYYMLISKNTSDYNLYTPDELIDAVGKGNIPFTSNVTKSTSYPQLAI
jgi:hypothetical protein